MKQFPPPKRRQIGDPLLRNRVFSDRQTTSFSRERESNFRALAGDSPDAVIAWFNSAEVDTPSVERCWLIEFCMAQSQSLTVSH